MFAGVRILKGCVSYYFMPFYDSAVRGMSPALEKRMQGTACFNFTQVDPELFAELGEVTRKGYESWKKIGWVD